MKKIESVFPDLKGDIIRIEIYDNNYTGSVKNLGCVDMKMSKESSKDNVFNTFFYNTLSISFATDEYDFFENNFFDDQKELTVHVYINNVIHWKGIQNDEGDNLQYTLKGAPYSVSFVDATIDKLKKQSSIVKIDGKKVSGYRSLGDIFSYFQTELNINIVFNNSVKYEKIRIDTFSNVPPQTEGYADFNEVRIGVDSIRDVDFCKTISILDFLVSLCKSNGFFFKTDTTTDTISISNVQSIELNSNNDKIIKVNTPEFNKSTSYEEILVSNDFASVDVNNMTFSDDEFSSIDVNSISGDELNIYNFIAAKFSKTVYRYRGNYTQTSSRPFYDDSEFELDLSCGVDFWYYDISNNYTSLTPQSNKLAPALEGMVIKSDKYKEENFQPIVTCGVSNVFGVGDRRVYFPVLSTTDYKMLNVMNLSGDGVEIPRLRVLNLKLKLAVERLKNLIPQFSKAYDYGLNGKHRFIVNIGYAVITPNPSISHYAYSATSQNWVSAGSGQDNGRMGDVVFYSDGFEIEISPASKRAQDFNFQINIPPLGLLGTEEGNIRAYLIPAPPTLENVKNNLVNGIDELTILDFSISIGEFENQGLPLEDNEIITTSINSNRLEVSLPMGYDNTISQASNQCIWLVNNSRTPYILPPEQQVIRPYNFGFRKMYLDIPSTGSLLPQYLPFTLDQSDYPTQENDAIEFIDYILLLYKYQFEKKYSILSCDFFLKYVGQMINNDILFEGKLYRQFETEYDYINNRLTGEFHQIVKPIIS